MATTPRNRTLVRIIVLSQFGPPFMFSAVAVALPTLGADLDAGATALALIETLFLAGSVSFLLPVGRLADATDKRTLYKTGLLSFAATSILIGVVSSVPLILALRFLQGVASAIFAATGPAILSELVPAEQRGGAYGSSMGAIYAGLTLGPIIGGLLTDVWGWRAVFLAGAAIILVGYALVQALLSSSWRWAPRSVHLPSSALVLGAVLCLVAGSATLHRGSVAYFWVASGVGLAVVFVLLQRRLDRPLVDVDRLLDNRVLSSALFIQLLLYVNAISSILMLSIYLQVSLERSARTAGQILAIGTILMAIMAPVAGRLADRYHVGRVSSFGVTGVLLSALLAATLDEQSSLGFVVAILAIQGLGFAFFSSPNLTIIMNSVASDEVSLASALGAKARSLGMISGMLITATLISLDFGNAPVERHPLRFVGTMGTAFSVLAALTTAALATSVLTRVRR